MTNTKVRVVAAVMAVGALFPTAAAASANTALPINKKPWTPAADKAFRNVILTPGVKLNAKYPDKYADCMLFYTKKHWTWTGFVFKVLTSDDGYDLWSKDPSAIACDRWYYKTGE